MPHRETVKKRAAAGREYPNTFCEKCAHRRPLHFLSVRVSNPHSKHYDDRGEDASVQTNRAIGVFDGIGAWKHDRVDVSAYTRSLARHTNHALMGEGHRSMQGASGAVYHAMTKADRRGTSTACVAGMDGERVRGTDVSTGRTLKGINIGDSGLMVIREGGIVYKTKEQSSDFNTPHQIGYRDRGDFSRGQKIKFDLKEEDIVLTMTDGISDNIYSRDILRIVRYHTDKWKTQRRDIVTGERNSGRLTSKMKRRFTEYHREEASVDRKYEKMPDRILELALDISRAAYEGAHDQHWNSPFSQKAKDEGQRGMYGGKEDDITIVIGFVVSSNMRSQTRVAIDCPRCTDD